WERSSGTSKRTTRTTFPRSPRWMCCGSEAPTFATLPRPSTPLRPRRRWAEGLCVGEHGESGQFDPLDELERRTAAGRDEPEAPHAPEILHDTGGIPAGGDVIPADLPEPREDLLRTVRKARVLRPAERSVPEHGLGPSEHLGEPSPGRGSDVPGDGARREVSDGVDRRLRLSRTLDDQVRRKDHLCSGRARPTE